MQINRFSKVKLSKWTEADEKEEKRKSYESNGKTLLIACSGVFAIIQTAGSVLVLAVLLELFVAVAVAAVLRLLLRLLVLLLLLHWSHQQQ
jgi:hypothetical protein